MSAMGTPVLFAPTQAMSTLSASLRRVYPAHVHPPPLCSNKANANLTSFAVGRRSHTSIQPKEPVHKPGVLVYIIGQGSGLFN